MRRRYKRARWIAAAAGALLAAAAVVASLADLEAAGLAPATGFYAVASLLLLAGVAGPWLMVEASWRRARRRHFDG